MKLSLKKILLEAEGQRGMSGDEAFQKWYKDFKPATEQFEDQYRAGLIRIEAAIETLESYIAGKPTYQSVIHKHYGELSPEEAEKFLSHVLDFDKAWESKWH